MRGMSPCRHSTSSTARCFAAKTRENSSSSWNGAGPPCEHEAPRLGKFHPAEQHRREQKIAKQHILGERQRGEVTLKQAGRSARIRHTVPGEPNFEVRQ